MVSSDEEIRIQVYNKTKGHCFYCGIGLINPAANKKGMEFVRLTIDHFIPLSKGGKTQLDNLVPACSRCNNQKSNKDPRKFSDASIANKFIL